MHALINTSMHTQVYNTHTCNRERKREKDLWHGGGRGCRWPVNGGGRSCRECLRLEDLIGKGVSVSMLADGGDRVGDGLPKVGVGKEKRGALVGMDHKLGWLRQGV